MAPRTYLRKQVSAQSAMELNTLIAKNMAKKCHSTGLHVDNSVFLQDNSWHLNKSDDTFTRMAKGENFNDVNFASDVAPYESFLSRSTVDISSLLGHTNNKVESINHSCKDDGCISMSMRVIQSWEEPKRDFVTLRKKSKRKAERSIVKEKTCAELNSTQACRISVSPNVANPKMEDTPMNKSGTRLSQRLVERYFNGHSHEDISISIMRKNCSDSILNQIDQASDSQKDNTTGFEEESVRRSKGLQIEHNVSLRNEQRSLSVRETSYRSHDASIQNVSKPYLLFANNGICDNSTFLGKHTSTPVIKTITSRKHLTNINTYTPMITRQSQARKKLENITAEHSYNSILIDNDESTSKSCRNRSRIQSKRTDLDDEPSVRVTRSTGLLKNRSILSVLFAQPPRSSRKTKVTGTVTPAVRDDSLSISTRTRSRSLVNDLSVILPAKNSHSEASGSMRLRSKSAGLLLTKSTCMDRTDDEPNKENMSDPYKRVTCRRKTTEMQSWQNISAINNKSLSIKEEPIEHVDNLECNYSIENITSPERQSNDIDLNVSENMQNFVPKYQGTPKIKTNLTDLTNSVIRQSVRHTTGNITPSDDNEKSVRRSPVCSPISGRKTPEEHCLNSTHETLDHSYGKRIKDEFTFALPLLPVMRNVYVPGKAYRRSILATRDTACFNKYANASNNSKRNEERRSSVRLVPVVSGLQRNISGGINAVSDDSYESPKRLQHQNSVHVGRCSLEPEVGPVIATDRSVSVLDDSVDEVVATQTAKDIVLRNCGQDQAEPWQTFYPDSLLKNCWKIGEGVYGEVFMFRNAKKAVSVMKVIPIEGDQMVNGERQKKFQDILSEIIIAKKLSSLSTSGFNRLESVHLVHGAYPELLLDHWRHYEEANGSENDCPDSFQTSSQLYLVLQLQNGGKDLESYEFTNAAEAYSIFVQMCHSLAQAEHHYSFEHRDLHWGNVLISPCPTDTTLTYTLPTSPNNNRDDVTQHTTYTVNTHGVSCNIIDFTLSRMTIPGGINRVGNGRWSGMGPSVDDYVLYNDLALDPELFNGEGDAQFDVYRQMRKETGDDWSEFRPKTNVYWMNYILQKMLTEIQYSKPEGRTHVSYLNKMRRCRSRIRQFSNCSDVVKSLI